MLLQNNIGFRQKSGSTIKANNIAIHYCTLFTHISLSKIGFAPFFGKSKDIISLIFAAESARRKIFFARLAYARYKKRRQPFLHRRKSKISTLVPAKLFFKRFFHS